MAEETTAIGSDVLPSPLPTNRALEERIRENTLEPGPYLVYADWLQSQGSPVGELVALAGKPEHEKRVADLEKQIGLPENNLATWGYRHGFFEWLRLENNVDWMSADFDAAAFASKLFATPLCAGLDELRIGILRWDDNNTDVPAVLAAAAQYGWAKTLTRLHLGDVTRNIDMAHHMIGDAGAAISAAFPALRSLKLHSGSQSWRDAGETTFGIGDLVLPKLESLVIETCAMSPERLANLFAGALPAVTKLELWFGSTDSECTATASDLAPLLEGEAFRKVIDLGLKNLDFMQGLLERLAASPILSRLERLDLSMSTLDASTAPHLAALAKQLTALRVLDVGDNFLSESDLSSLRASFPQVDVVSKAQDKLGYAEGEDRFVSVHE